MWRWLLSALIVCAVAWAQPRPPLGILRADLRSWEGSWDGGRLLLTLDSGIDYECSFDGKTFFERDRSRISIGRLRPGDHLEVVSDRTTQASSRCFARLVKVVAKVAADDGSRWGQVTRATESISPRGSLIYAGTVAEISGNVFVLKTRAGERHTIRLRTDTRYVDNGAPSTRAILTINVGVYVRAGVSLDDDIEAYQVVAGEILQPGRGSTRLQ